MKSEIEEDSHFGRHENCLVPAVISRSMVRNGLLGLSVLAGATLELPAADMDSDLHTRRPLASDVKRFKTKPALETGSSIGPRIIGGSTAAAGEFPWMAAIVHRSISNNYNAQFAGGVLIHPYWVLSAAHTVVGNRPDQVDVVLGVNNLNSSTGVQRRRIAEIIHHPRYHDIIQDHDVVLLRLETPADLPVAPIPLIDDVSLADPGITATVAGWGKTSVSGSSTPLLRKVDLPIVDLNVVNATAAYNGTLTANMLAAGFAAGGKDACQGDSGGPLMVPSPVGPGKMVAGLVSFGKGCAQPDAYGIYTRIANYRQFILDHVYPGYGSWETANGLAGEYRDPDQNGWPNWQEFALASTPPAPLDGPNPGLRIRRPLGGGGISYGIELSGNLEAGSWSSLDPVTDTISTSASADLPGFEDWLVASPSPLSSFPSGKAFLRTQVSIGSHYAPGPRPLQIPGSAAGALTSVDPVHPTSPGHFSKIYRISHPAPGNELRISLRSSDFAAKLELVDPLTGSAFASASGNSGLGKTGFDQVLSHTPAGPEEFFVRVTSQSAGQTGPFVLSVWEASALASVAPLAVPQTVSSSFTASSPLEPAYLPGRQFRMAEYLLDTSSVPAGSPVQIDMTSGSVDAFLEFYNAETGMLMFWKNDGGTGSNARSFFVPTTGGPRYLIRATSTSQLASGAFAVQASVASPPSIGTAQTLNGSLAASDQEDPSFPGTYMDEYLLNGGSAGQTIRVTLNSTAIDAFLFILDAADYSFVASNDDRNAATSNSLVEFTLKPGARYLIRATSYGAGEIGNYTLQTSVVSP